MQISTKTLRYVRVFDNRLIFHLKHKLESKKGRSPFFDGIVIDLTFNGENRLNPN